MGGHPTYGRAHFCFKKGCFFCRFGAHGAGTTGTVSAVSGAGNRVGTYIYPYEPATGSGSAVGARGERGQTPHTNLLAYHLKPEPKAWRKAPSSPHRMLTFSVLV